MSRAPFSPLDSATQQALAHRAATTTPTTGSLSPAEWVELDRIILVLHALETPEAFEDFVLGPLTQFLGADFASWNVHDQHMHMVRVANSPAYASRIAPLVDALNRTLPSHPLFRHYIDFESGTVRRVETVERTREHVAEDTFRALPFYHEVAAPLQIEDQLIMQISIAHAGGILLTFHSHRLFTPTEHLKAAILRGHILARQYTLQRQADEHARESRHVRVRLMQTLSGREFETMQWLCRGLSNSEIGLRLGISTRTVDRHVSNLLAKLGIDCRTRVIARYAAWLEDTTDKIG
ncbi:helix-turn-helix transcriptional regulator [Actomonas aquatica]|uniref:Helix-turn-helix transcriptional regulator n=1 Tax=Actomonas aquatica TaxID=2866162 RepID=A0ABZ1C3E5_9BACT|nr:helix-turn-helix transcriptional regulator [Opitutus sp. WL0086]WRQ86016.1 helix-turn-helix transcriptional regulator [Opitutus sp. WL0086]